jgi:ABC-type Mn2+/Zn2+ transport system permease subunit
MRVTIETTFAIIGLLLAALTAISAEWIEELTGLEPDAASGALEWVITIAFAVAAVTLGWLARGDARRLRAAKR